MHVVALTRSRRRVIDSRTLYISLHAPMTNDRKAQARMKLYDELRSACLEQLSGKQASSVASQLRSLFLADAVFRMLNEARRIEEGRAISGVAWRLTAAGHAVLLATGIRRLVDKDKRAGSLAGIIARLRGGQELLTRRHYVEVGGDPYDYEGEKVKYFRDVIEASVDDTDAVHRGHIDWVHSQYKHKRFDQLSDGEGRDPEQLIGLSVLDKLSAALTSDAIRRVTTYTDKVIAHAEHLTDAIELPSYNDVDESLRTLCQVSNFISTAIFYDSDRSQVVPTPQYDVTQHLDAPLALSKTLPDLQQFWADYSRERDGWSSAESGYDQQFLVLQPNADDEPKAHAGSF